MSKKVLIPLADGCEELEAVTLIDLLRRADIEVTTAGLEELTITASRGTRLIADVLLDDIEDQLFDMVILPGGQPGTDNLNADPLIHDLLLRHDEHERAIAAICAAPLVLAEAGLLDGKQACCYPGAINQEDWPAIVLTDQAVTIDGHTLTSRGPGTAMDFALAIIDYLLDSAQRERVEAPLLR